MQKQWYIIFQKFVKGKIFYKYFVFITFTVKTVVLWNIIAI